ncbi:ankyrin repeat domain-containing protein [Mycobacterium sp. MYCO198283]|uniref:ankyrin repeat domain-containing protein n=1 Tax=Mycobacterium sp. MYCO198283 TaxID=2883505 RepID=UPI001E358EEF|nr:ankyrin repeat domain-containing protein [Mycobacterium sp. MYCO198283]MCG5430895.1 ankyrin repeat domain-containing protein [Mycobacterium sp. MYCO198283]
MARSGRPPKIDPMKPIHRAVLHNDVNTFAVELAAGNYVNAPGPEGMTPLHIAADYGRVEFAKALLNKGVDIDPINVWGNTPLWMAVYNYDKTEPPGAIIRLLLEHGADPNRGEGRQPPLELATMIAGFPEDLIELLEEHAHR